MMLVAVADAEERTGSFRHRPKGVFGRCGIRQPASVCY